VDFFVCVTLGLEKKITSNGLCVRQRNDDGSGVGEKNIFSGFFNFSRFLPLQVIYKVQVIFARDLCITLAVWEN
jgi:hypothetical protein